MVALKHNCLISLAKELVANNLIVFYPKSKSFQGTYMFVSNGRNVIYIQYDSLYGALSMSFVIYPSKKCGSSAALCQYDTEKGKYVNIDVSVENIKKVLAVNDSKELKPYIPYIRNWFNEFLMFKSLEDYFRYHDRFNKEIIYFKDEVINALHDDNDSILNWWKSMTADNLHTEVRMKIAQFFGLNAYYEYMSELSDTHKKQGYLTLEQMEERLEKTNEMLIDIRNLFGDETYKAVYFCL